MTTIIPSDFCPYKGLQPYTELDRAFFFGRERDQEVVASNLYAAPLTILYGASGVGKTSVLLAGVVPQLRQTPRLGVVVFRTWQDVNFLSALKSQTLEAASRSAGKPIQVDPSQPFDEFLRECATALRGDLFFILDQFEEYFLYHAPTPDESGFDAEFARAVNRREVPANFLLSMREDSLSRLDRFKGRIPNLLGNMLRLEHLDHAAAVSAIRKPLEEYNRDLLPEQSPVSIEDDLVETVITQVQTGSVALGRSGAGALADSSETRVETPYLQLVMTRLWDEERQAGSSVLRLAMLKRLGGAQQIVRTHLDTTMTRLAGSERDVAARAFRFLVTPSQTKVAYTVADLATYADVPSAKLAPVLDKLAGPEVRVLRSVAPQSGEKQEPRYEIFHDVLAPAVLDWRERYLEQTRTRRLRTVGALIVSAFLFLIVASVAIQWSTTSAFVQQAQEARITAQVQQTKVQVAETQVQAAATQVRAEQQQAQVAQTQVSVAQKSAQQQAATQTVAAQAALQAAATQDAVARQAAQAQQTQAAIAAALSQSVLRTPVAPPIGTTPEPTTVAVRTIAAAAGTSAAQVLQFSVTDVKVSVSPESSTTCPATFNSLAVISTNQAGSVTFRWEHSDGTLLPQSNLTFTAAGTKTVTDTLTLSYPTSGWVRLQILAPKALTSDRANLTLRLPVATALQSALDKDTKARTILGCPKGSSQTMAGAVQPFENGLMFWREDTGKIYVLSKDSTWSVYADTWDSSQQADGFFKPPTGLYEPRRGFGKVWREQLKGPDSKIGWATKPETSTKLRIQDFEHGFAYMDDTGDIKVIFLDGKWTDL